MNLLTLLPKARAEAGRILGLQPLPGRKAAPLRPVEAQAPIPLPADLQRQLVALHHHHRLVSVGTGAAMLVGAVSALMVAQTLADWSFDLPWLARAGFLAGDLVFLGKLYRRHLRDALRHKPGLAETALLVEKKWPDLQQSLISAVELAEGKRYATRGSPQLLDNLLQQARARVKALNFKEAVPTHSLRRWLLLGGGAALGSMVLAVAAWPASLSLVERLLLLNVPLPTKTIVVAITRDLIVPVGSDVEISARAQGVIPAHGRVNLTYAGTAAQEVPLDAQPDKPDVFSFTALNVQTDFKYQFQLNDGHGGEFKVSARILPAVADLECEQIYPAYTNLPPEKTPPSQLSLLVGSHLQVKATATEELKSATVILQGMARKIDMTLDASGTRLEADIPVPTKGLTGFSLHLVNRAGISSANETVYPVVLIPDKPPLVKITEPEEESETITLRAKPVIAFEASDDYGLTRLTLNYELVPPPVAGGDTPAAQPVTSIPIAIKPSSEGRHYEYTLDAALQTPPWKEGWTVHYWIEAVDNNTATGPGVTRSERRQFGILSTEAKQAEILERIKQNAHALDGLSDSQQKIINDVGETIPKK